MSALTLLIGFAVATLGWQLVAEVFGQPLAQRIYTARLNRIKSSGLTFRDDDAVQTWVQKTSTSSMHLSLLALAVVCGVAAGALNFPLMGFSRSLNGWSWLRLGVLCCVSWWVALTFHADKW